MTRPPSPSLAETLAFARKLAAATPVRMRPFLVGFSVALLLQACAAASLVGSAASVAATTTVDAGAAVASAGISAAASAAKTAVP